VNDDTFDPETLAAFLDGKLAGAERDRVLQLLAESDQWYEVMVEASQVSAELARSAPTWLSKRPWNRRLPLRLANRGAWRRQAVFGGAVIAAGLATVVVLSERRGGVDGIGDSAQLVIDERLRAGRAAEWGAARGNDAALSTRARAFRVGVQFADLELAARMRDSANVQSLSASIADLTKVVPTGGATASRVRYLGRNGSLPVSSNERQDVASELRSLVGELWFDLGAWSETARRAAHAGQLQYFEAGRPAMQHLDSLLAAAEQLPTAERTGTEAAVGRLRSLRTDVVSPGRGLSSAAAALDSTVAELGN